MLRVTPIQELLHLFLSIERILNLKYKVVPLKVQVYWLTGGLDYYLACNITF